MRAAISPNARHDGLESREGLRKRRGCAAKSGRDCVCHRRNGAFLFGFCSNGFTLVVAERAGGLFRVTWRTAFKVSKKYWENQEGQWREIRACVPMCDTLTEEFMVVRGTR
jgi:hypothetical protein